MNKTFNIFKCHFRTPFRKIPVVEGKEIDLYLLYWLVTAQGGWEKVRNKKTCKTV